MMFWLALIPPVFSRVMAASVARTSLDK